MKIIIKLQEKRDNVVVATGATRSEELVATCHNLVARGYWATVNVEP